jgi:hypothetical protein
MRLNSEQAIENGRMLLREHGTWLKVIAAQRSLSNMPAATNKRGSPGPLRKSA